MQREARNGAVQRGGWGKDKADAVGKERREAEETQRERYEWIRVYFSRLHTRK